VNVRTSGRRRSDDLDPLVRKWVRQGSVRPAVAARFLASRLADDRRQLRWEALGRPTRRASDLPGWAPDPAQTAPAGTARAGDRRISAFATAAIARCIGWGHGRLRGLATLVLTDAG
jgi:hypothetical protein